MLICGISASPSGLMMPASNRMKVVFPVPFSPNKTRISESVNPPFSTLNLKPPMVLHMFGYSYLLNFLASSRSVLSATLKEREKSLKRKFSVGTNPKRD